MHKPSCWGTCKKPSDLTSVSCMPVEARAAENAFLLMVINSQQEYNAVQQQTWQPAFIWFMSWHHMHSRLT